MNVLKAREILELPDNYDEILLKKQHRSLAMKYHPDKNKTQENQRFSEIQEAYEFLSNNNQSGNEPGIQFQKVDNLFSTIFKSFNFQFQPFQQFPKSQPKKEVFIKLTAKEYLTGTVKSVMIKERCSCEGILCTNCAGCGFNVPPPVHKPLDPCMNCVGEGYIQNCKDCQNGFINKNITIHIAPTIKDFEIFHPLVGLIKLSIEEPYFIRDNKLYCPFDISLKESLTGFNKIFKDPFGDEHPININTVVKSNDGYQLNNIILVFNVIFPKKLSQSVIDQLKKIDF